MFDDCSQWDTVSKAVDHIFNELKKRDELEDAYGMLDPDFKAPQGVDPIMALGCKQHFSRTIRNNFGLWKSNTKLAEDCIKIDPETATATLRMWSKDGSISGSAIDSLLCGVVHPDDASCVIEKQLFKKIKEEKSG